MQPVGLRRVSVLLSFCLCCCRLRPTGAVTNGPFLHLVLLVFQDLHLCATVLFVLGSATTCVPFAADLSSFTVDVVPGEPKTLLMYALSKLLWDRFLVVA